MKLSLVVITLNGV